MNRWIYNVETRKSVLHIYIEANWYITIAMTKNWYNFLTSEFLFPICITCNTYIWMYYLFSIHKVACSCELRNLYTLFSLKFLARSKLFFPQSDTSKFCKNQRYLWIKKFWFFFFAFQEFQVAQKQKRWMERPRI